MELGSLSQPDFDDRVRLLLVRRARAIASALETRRRRLAADGRDYWAADLDEQRRVLEQAITRPDYPRPIDLLTHSPAADAPHTHTTRDLVREFGALLSWWPAIVDRTMELAAAGRVPYLPVS